MFVCHINVLIMNRCADEQDFLFFNFLLSQFPTALRYISSEKVKAFVSKSFPNLCNPML